MILIKEAEKLTFKQMLTVTAPQAMEALLKDATNRWMSKACLAQNQALLLDKDRLTFDKSLAINPATPVLDGNP